MILLSFLFVVGSASLGLLNFCRCYKFQWDLFQADSLSVAEPGMAPEPWLGRRDSFTFGCCAPGSKNGNGILQLFFPFLLKDCLGSEDQSCFRTLHRDWKEEERKGLLRYTMGCRGLIFCGKVHGQENTLMTFVSPLLFHHSSLTKSNRHWEVDGEYCWRHWTKTLQVPW